jgi:hypothetical protein
MRTACERSVLAREGFAWLTPVVGTSVEILRFAQNDTKKEHRFPFENTQGRLRSFDSADFAEDDTKIEESSSWSSFDFCSFRSG